MDLSISSFGSWVSVIECGLTALITLLTYVVVASFVQFPSKIDDDFDPILRSSLRTKGHHYLSKYHVDLIAKRKWKEILAWIVFHPDELVSLDKTGQSFLHHACLFRAPAEVIQMILWQAPELASVPNQDGEVPLHWAIRLSAPNEHIASILQASPTCGTEMKDKEGYSPLSLLWDRHRQDIMEMYWTDRTQVQTLYAWKPIMLFFPCSNNNNNNNSNTASEEGLETPLHVACRLDCPPGLFPLFLEIFANHILQPDHIGRLPLHIACLDARVNRRPCEVKTKIQMLLLTSSAAGIQSCARKDHQGRLPFHYALQTGVTWLEGLKELFDASPRLLNERDPITLLYPFLLAAAHAEEHGESQSNSTISTNSHLNGGKSQVPRSYPSKSLNTIYKILRMDPSLVRRM